MNVIPIKKYYVRSEVEKDTEYLYIFTDNLQRSSGANIISRDSLYYKLFIDSVLRVDLFYGFRTQALIRGLNNAFPISTMVDGHGTQFIDADYNRFKDSLDFEITTIKWAYKHFNYKGIKYNNEMPFGEGTISKMKITAPKCWEYLNIKLLEININNELDKNK